MRIAVTRGRLERQRASALITSANDALVGNLQPAYWRFQGRDSVDGAVRAAGGADLEAACLALPALGALGGGSGGDSDDSMVRSTVRRDIFRWAAAVKRGTDAWPKQSARSTHVPRTSSRKSEGVEEARNRLAGAGYSGSDSSQMTPAVPQQLVAAHPILPSREVSVAQSVYASWGSPICHWVKDISWNTPSTVVQVPPSRWNISFK